MMIEAKKLINLPVAAVDIESKIGVIREIVIDPENGKLLGFLVKTGTIFSRTLALSIVDVKDWDPNGLVTGSVENLVEAKEIIRLKEALDKNPSFFNLGAQTVSGKRLGICEDFLIDTETESIVKFYLKDLLGNSRIFTANDLVRVDKKLIFKDDTTEIPSNSATAIA